jgi:class 3 adenylate cyclase
MVVEGRDRLPMEDRIVGKLGARRDSASPRDLEVEPPPGRLARIQRRHQPPWGTDGSVALSGMGDPHGPESIGATSMRDNPRMARLQSRPLGTPDEVRTFPHGRLEIFQLDDVVIGRTLFEPGWHWAEDVKPIAGTASCQYHHLGVCVSGRLGIRMDDGSTLEIGPGMVFDIPAGHDGWVIGDETWETYDFAGMRAFARAIEPDERVLASILFTDVVDSTATAERLGDGRWRSLVSQLNERSQFEIDRLRGRLIKTTGDGVIGLFDSSDRAVRCATRLIAEAESLGLGLRAGVHTGEVEIIPGDVRGLAVHYASRVLAQSAAGEVWVSGTTNDLLAGSSLRFEDRGEYELKGISGRRRLFALVTASDSPSA